MHGFKSAIFKRFKIETKSGKIRTVLTFFKAIDREKKRTLEIQKS